MGLSVSATATLVFAAARLLPVRADEPPPNCPAIDNPRSTVAFWQTAFVPRSREPSDLELAVTCVDRLTQADGMELIRVVGIVSNRTKVPQAVPPLYVFVTDPSRRIISRWTIAPTARELGAGGIMTFDSSEPDIPPGGDDLTISLSDALPQRSP